MGFLIILSSRAFSSEQISEESLDLVQTHLCPILPEIILGQASWRQCPLSIQGGEYASSAIMDAAMAAFAQNGHSCQAHQTSAPRPISAANCSAANDAFGAGSGFSLRYERTAALRTKRTSDFLVIPNVVYALEKLQTIKTMAQQEQHRIFMVHGTFVENAAWIQRDSKIALNLQKSLCAKVIPFSWSGKNSHAARSEAAVALANALRKDAQEEPNATRSIVAHSHGGNVSILAIGELEEEVPVKFLFCLGTPFLVYAPSYSHRLGVAISHLLWLSLFALMLLPLFYVGVFALITLAVEDFNHWDTAVALLLFAVVLVLAFRIPTFLVKKINSMIVRKHQKLFNKLRWPGETSTKLVNYQVSWDEARLIVSFFSAISGLPRRIWDIGARVFLKYSFSVFAFSIIIAGLFEYFELKNENLVTIFMLPFMLVLFVFILLIPLSFFALISPLIRSHPAGFGWEGLFQHFVYDVTITRNPQPHWRGLVLNESMKLGTGVVRIRHSAFYDNENVIEYVATKLRS